MWAGAGDLLIGFLKCAAIVFGSAQQGYLSSGSRLVALYGHSAVGGTTDGRDPDLARRSVRCFDTSLWQQLGWWQRSSAIACICLGGFAVYIAVLGFGGMRLSDLKGPAKATTSKD